jgi:hypothetical protein
MVKPTVDNTPITVMLDDNETFTPTTGDVIKAFLQVPSDERVSLQVGNGPDLLLTNQTNTSGNGDEIVLTDQTTLTSGARTGQSGVYISGFVVN